VKKTGSNLISFPKPRRTDQTGLTQRGFPARWLGLLVMTTVGAAFALTPPHEDAYQSAPDTVEVVDSIVFEGEPQVVAQLMGATVGVQNTPTRELRTLSRRSTSERRVVVAKSGSGEALESSRQAELQAVVEQMESDYAANGRYPAASPDGVVGYETDGKRFRLEVGAFSYDSSQGSKVNGDASSEPSFAIAGHLTQKETGWGPWRSTQQEFAPQGGRGGEKLGWLTEAVVTPAWSAKMYFPVSAQHTGYAFHAADGTSPYSHGEFLYDGVTGTFQMKLNRKKPSQGRTFSAAQLEGELSPSAPGNELVGDSQLLRDLGFLRTVEQGESVVHLANANRLALSADSAVDGLSLSAFARHKKSLKPGRYVGASEDDSTTAVVGRLELVDKLGQVHRVRIRAGQAGDYDWVVGQLCPLEPNEQGVAVAETVGYDDAFKRGNNTSTVIAGK
jgi:hypothetical protein